MNIAIDIGNTRAKMAIFKNDRIEKLFIGSFEVIFNFLKKISFSSGIISNVGNDDYTEKLLSFDSLLIDFISFDEINSNFFCPPVK